MIEANLHGRLHLHNISRTFSIGVEPCPFNEALTPTNHIQVLKLVHNNIEFTNIWIETNRATIVSKIVSLHCT